MATKLILFDLEDVLVNSWHSISDKLDIDEADFKVIDHSDLRVDLQLGKITEDKFFEEFIKLTHTKFSVDQLKTLVREALIPKKEMIEFAKELKSKYKIAILSNFTKEWADYLIRKYEIDKIFDATFWSFERGLKKPWHDAYLQVTKHFGIAPQETLFIDDKIRNTEAAAKLGFQVVTFEGIGQLKRDLDVLGVNVKPTIVLIGGGTGLPNLIRGLKKYDVNISTIVAITDNGRNSGMLRKDYKIPPPGDIRNSLVALSEVDETLKKAFDYRFLDGYLEGTSIGNLLLLSFTKLFGSFEKAIEHAGKILEIRGKVLPVSNADVNICAEYNDGTIIEGEVSIRENKTPNAHIKRVFLKPNDVNALPEVIEEIMRADMVVIGPGRLYTSIITNLLVNGVADAIIKSPARKVYICNTMTEPNVTDNLTASGFLKVLRDYLGKDVFDHIIVNSSNPSQETLDNFEKNFGVKMVKLDRENLGNINVIDGDFMHDEIKFKWNELSFLNHDPDKIASALFSIVKK